MSYLIVNPTLGETRAKAEAVAAPYGARTEETHVSETSRDRTGTPRGTIGWVDLTVENADEVLSFYREVVGFETSEVDMGGYSDYCLNTPGTDAAVAGVCHARGKNAEQPGGWMIYLTVEDLDASLARCRELGGSVVGEIRGQAGEGRFCVIKDPSGALAALYQAG